MKWRVFALLVCLCGSRTSRAQLQPNLLPDAPKPQTGIIVGTVTDVNGDTVPGATVALESPEDPRTVVTNDNGFFEFNAVEPGTYHVTVSAGGFASWTSPPVILKPGQYEILTGSKLRIAQALTSITVASPPGSSKEIAAQQLKVEEQQRIFGIIPNFYVAYDRDAAPLTAKMKFQLALKVSFDPVTIIGVAALAGIDQAGDVPNYSQGAKGYGERYGAIYADGLTDIMVGGAILPSLLHQDPRYFYQGTGTSKSRAVHALTSPFISRGDNGRWQPNYSTMGGDLASAAIANAYYPPSNRGLGLLLGNFFINTGQRAVANLAQEFVLRRVTSRAKSQN
ncbi:MAG: carboxypeptidase regulatory-like domain-containing protein [Candidatus Sulfotelmatobacter sp.]